ncbi:glycoside hydrolase family protein [Sphingomonas nostoxanthinifaciens]|uniref:glycosidase n=1 Tax=Sphingomonas nostoxanthinifaciens TaxID=2872652 RepID=UPI001CC1FD5C|nr:glycosidase [Sphingomonas nostoxanthinifaciens]UAK25636.1 glycosidase [Sphingomonas nostoxanthinifaciens]
MVAYVVEQLDTVTISAKSLIDGMDLMSPFVWKEGALYRVMIRGVPDPRGPHDPTGVIAGGASRDGLAFIMDAGLAITPGPGPADIGGCEDPTVLTDNGQYLIYYTGVDAARLQGGMILAAGADLSALVKEEVVLTAPPGEGNIKEATLAQTSKGDWRLFYEYAANGASRIGMATGPTPKGPWSVGDDPFGIREDSWDNWHLSTGPITQLPGQDPVMFYNGATHDARWRIGWISFDPDFTRVTGRGLEPMLVPPPAITREATDIAFAASTVMEGDLIALYYSLEDRMLRRALVRRYTG